MTGKRMERLVRLRRLAEQASAAELEARRDGLRATRAELDAVVAAIDATDAALDGAETAAEVLQVAAYREHLASTARATTETLARKAQEVAAGEVEVQGAWRERRLLEAVHERIAQREAAEEVGRAHKAMESIALTRYGRSES